MADNPRPQPSTGSKGGQNNPAPGKPGDTGKQSAPQK